LEWIQEPPYIGGREEL
jgi:hypothetical protein